MHNTAKQNFSYFLQTYLESFDEGRPIKIIEIGSQDVNGSLRDVLPENYPIDYIGVDFVAGKGVDVILDDPYKLPFEDATADIVVSSSCFEHSQFFWLLHLEIMRLLKPKGLFYLNAPSNGPFHRYPVDCWRFYPDSGVALVEWANHNKMNSVLLESYTSIQGSIHNNDPWNDFVAIILKDKNYLNNFSNRIIDSFEDFDNGLKQGSTEIMKHKVYPEDQRMVLLISNIVQQQIRAV